MTALTRDQLLREYAHLYRIPWKRARRSWLTKTALWWLIVEAKRERAA